VVCRFDRKSHYQSFDETGGPCAYPVDSYRKDGQSSAALIVVFTTSARGLTGAWSRRANSLARLMPEALGLL
jgi:hypothetical protein